jgi:hypothetical protein
VVRKTALERICAIGRVALGSRVTAVCRNHKGTTASQRQSGSAGNPDFMASGAVLGDAGERPPEGLRAAGRDARGDQPACCNPAVGLGIPDLTAPAVAAG